MAIRFFFCSLLLLSPAFGKPSLFVVCSCISFISSVLFGLLLYCNSFYFILGIYFVSSIKVNSFAGRVYVFMKSRAVHLSERPFASST